jgi:hypothetical protein
MVDLFLVEEHEQNYNGTVDTITHHVVVEVDLDEYTERGSFEYAMLKAALCKRGGYYMNPAELVPTDDHGYMYACGEYPYMYEVRRLPYSKD